MGTALDFTRIKATKEGYVHWAYAEHDNEAFNITLRTDKKWTTNEPFTRYLVEIVREGKVIFSEVMLVPDILRFMYNRELAILGMKPIDVPVHIPYANTPYGYIAKVFYANPECSHVQII